MTKPQDHALSQSLQSLSVPSLLVPLCEHLFTDDDKDELVRQIAHLVKRETRLGVQDMKVQFENGKMILTGLTRTFYAKQLAQEAALRVIGNVVLVNAIRVA